MPATVIEKVPGMCREAKLVHIQHQYELVEADMPMLGISLPFSVDIRCEGDDVHVVVSYGRRSSVMFTWRAIHYRRQGESVATEVPLTSMSVLDIVLLHYLEKYGGVLSSILEFVKEHGGKAVSNCRELINTASAIGTMLQA